MIVDYHTHHYLVAAGFERAVALLREVGYREIATFERRRRRMVPLD
jgi:hypothetical protein